MAKSLHPSVEQFKQFVKKHPRLVMEVREGKKNWQELYEDWYLLGEEDPTWKAYKNEVAATKEDNSSDSSFLTGILSKIKTLDYQNVEKHISSVSSAIGTIQSLLSEFQKQPPSSSKQTSERPNPFSFRKD